MDVILYSPLGQTFKSLNFSHQTSSLLLQKASHVNDKLSAYHLKCWIFFQMTKNQNMFIELETG